jgi:YtkA-like protein
MTMKQHSKVIAELLRRGLLLVAAVLAFSSRAQADGGFVELHQEAGPFVVTVFAAPGPLRAGPVDISVLVQDRPSGQPVLDAEVFVRLEGPGATTLVERATREAAQNKLLYSALLNLPEAGQWELEVTIKQGKETASIVGQVSAAAPTPFLLSYWRSLLLPPIVIAVFALNQLLKRRSAHSKERQQPRIPQVT